MSPSGKERRGPRWNLWRVSLILAAAGLTTASCQTVQDVDIAQPRLRIQFQVSSTPPPEVNLYKFSWAGSWCESEGVTGDGDTEASDSRDVTPEAVDEEEAFLYKFPVSPALRSGRWQISAAVTKNGGTTSSGSCILEIFSGLPTVVTFTEGLTDCAPQLGGGLTDCAPQLGGP